MKVVIFSIFATGFVCSLVEVDANSSSSKSKFPGLTRAVFQGKCVLLSGKDGRDGRDGKDGRDGRQGVMGVTGPSGPQGPPGSQGPRGDTGIRGRMGLRGLRGKPGRTGEKGEPGTCNISGEILTLVKKQREEIDILKQKISSFAKQPCCASSSRGLHLFEKIQDIPTKGAKGVEQFEIGGHLYLAFANSYGDRHRFKVNSTIYRFEENKFVKFQLLPSIGSWSIKHFLIDGQHFLAVSSYTDGNTGNLNSIIYRWNGNQFVSFQEIPTYRAIRMEFFAIEKDQFLAIANYHNGSSHLINSNIYKWQQNQFVKFQDIRTNGCSDITSFVIANQTYLAFANSFVSQQRQSAQSEVYKWSFDRFVKIQLLQTFGATGIHAVEVSGRTFLAVANHDPSRSRQGSSTLSFIYIWDGLGFTLFQRIKTYGVAYWRSVVFNGDTFLAFANFHDESKIYKATGAKFTKYQDFPTQGATDLYPFVTGGSFYLVAANSYNNKWNINSEVFKWV